jgi:hypothetical protein
VIAAAITSQAMIGYSRRTASGSAVSAAAASAAAGAWTVTGWVMMAPPGPTNRFCRVRSATSMTAPTAAATAIAASSASAQPDGGRRGSALPRKATSLCARPVMRPLSPDRGRGAIARRV